MSARRGELIYAFVSSLHKTKLKCQKIDTSVAKCGIVRICVLNYLKSQPRGRNMYLDYIVFPKLTTWPRQDEFFIWFFKTCLSA